MRGCASSKWLTRLGKKALLGHGLLRSSWLLLRKERGLGLRKAMSMPSRDNILQILQERITSGLDDLLLIFLEMLLGFEPD